MATLAPSRRAPAQAENAPLALSVRSLALLVALALALGFSGRAAYFLADPDTLWHVVSGGDIWAHKRFPHVDPYTHSQTGEPWIAKEWLSQIILAGAHALGGFSALAALGVACVAGAGAALFHRLAAVWRSNAAAYVAIGACAMCASAFLARPHLIVLPVVIAFAGAMWRAAERARAPSLWWLAGVALWSNLHASVPLAFVAAFCAFLHYLDKTRALRAPETRRWVLFGLACPVAAMIHPYGYEALASSVLQSGHDAIGYVAEWRAFSAQDDPWRGIVILGAVMGALATGLKVRPAPLIFVAFLAAIYFTHTRFVVFLFLLAPIALAPDLARHFLILAKSTAAPPAALARDRAVSGALAALIAALVALMAKAGGYAPAKPSYPIEAIEAAREAGLTEGNVLNQYGFGGALIYEGIETFMDGRADRLFRGFFPAVAETRKVDGAAALRDQIERYAMSWAILAPSDQRGRHLDAFADWERVYEDEFAIVYRRRAPGAISSETRPD